MTDTIYLIMTAISYVVFRRFCWYSKVDDDGMILPAMIWPVSYLCLAFIILEGLLLIKGRFRLPPRLRND